MRKMQQILGGEMASLPGRRVLLILLVMLVSLGMAASGCGPVTDETPTEIAPDVIPTATPELTIVRFAPEQTAQLEYEGPAVPLSWQGTEYLVVPLTPQADCNPEDKCNRIVMDFKVVEDLGRGDDNPLVTQFDSPLEIEVPYTADDVEDVDGVLEDLTLRYWDGERWVAFTESEHQFSLEGDEQGGFGYVEITEWGDREIAWGGPE